MSKKKKIIVGLISGLIIIAALLAVSELTGLTHIFRKKTPLVVTGSSFNTKGEAGGTASTGQNASGSSSNTSDSKSVGSSATLVSPSGDFVSNHHPNLSGSPAPNTMSSVCNTVPGASCKITFTQNGVTKSLPAQTADSNGSTYWNWKLQDIGLTAGSWKIEAIASLNGQTKTASDAMDLVVSQ